MLDTLKKTIFSALTELYPQVSVPEFNIEIPSDRTKADFVCNIPFLLAKILNQNPFLIASVIVDKIKKDESLVCDATYEAFKPGFINIHVTDEYLNRTINVVLEKGENYGKSSTLCGQKWIIEHTSPNPNKPMHIGHLRNNLIGVSVANLLEFNGASVVCEGVDNDRGIAIIKAMWGYLVHKHRAGKKDPNVHYWYENQDEWVLPGDEGKKSDHFVGECYILGSDDFKNDSRSENSMRDMLVKWEKNDPEVWALWKKILEYAHTGIGETLKRIGNRWDHIWYEHEHYLSGKQLVLEGLEKKIFCTIEGGAVLTDLKAYKLPDTILLRSDGTSLYITQDIALTKIKKDHHKADKLVWVVGNEQSLAMKQVFAICEQLGFGKVEDFFHISYGQVSIKDETGGVKKMSSRDGGTVLVDDLIDNVEKQLVSSRPNSSNKDVEKLAIAAIKFSLLKSGRMTNIVFDTKASISIDGVSGVYVLYTYARLFSLISKAPRKFDPSVPKKFSKFERDVLINLCYFPIIVADSIKDFSPQMIAEFLTVLSQLFNSLYGNEKFILEGDEDETNKKISIAEATGVVIQNALRIMGINPVEKMA